MNRIITLYIKACVNNIQNNKAFAIFFTFGAMFTFLFIILILQGMDEIFGERPPLTNANRIVQISNFTDETGQPIGGITDVGIKQISQTIKGYECLSIKNCQSVNVSISNRSILCRIGFVNEDYFKVHALKVIQGRIFTKDDYPSTEAVAVVKESIAKKYFSSDNIVNNYIEFQGRIYKIIGVVEDFTSLTGDLSSIWVPYIYNKFIPDTAPYYVIDVLFPVEMSHQEMKKNIYQGIIQYWHQQNIAVDITLEQIHILKDSLYKAWNSNLLIYGSFIAIILLLIVPGVNIIVLNISYVEIRAKEIALRRVLGASFIGSFVQILIETFILVVIGTIFGLFLTTPVLHWVDTYYGSSFDGLTLTGGINYQVIILYVMPLTILFTLLSGGIPAYLIAHRNISQTLKGGTK